MFQLQQQQQQQSSPLQQSHGSSMSMESLFPFAHAAMLRAAETVPPLTNKPATMKPTTTTKPSTTTTTLSSSIPSALISFNEHVLAHNDVKIHVVDEGNGVRRDIYCNFSVLITGIKYFQGYLSRVKRANDIDISVHCDLSTFEWLVEFINFPKLERWKVLAASICAENQRKHQLEEDEADAAAGAGVAAKDVASGSPTIALQLDQRRKKWKSVYEQSRDLFSSENMQRKTPLITIDNVVSLLVPADFLKVSGLVKVCLAFFKIYCNEILRSTPDVGLINNRLLSKLAPLFTNVELEALKDDEGGYVSKLFMFKLQQHLSLPQHALFKCQYCFRLYSRSQVGCSVCRVGQPMIDFHGQLHAPHHPHPHWTTERYLFTLRLKGLTWRRIYWKIWSKLARFHCTACRQSFQAAELLLCAYHPHEALFPRGENAGFYTCCQSPTTRFSLTDHRPGGCRTRVHQVDPRSVPPLLMAILLNQAKNQHPQQQQQQQQQGILLKADPPSSGNGGNAANNRSSNMTVPNAPATATTTTTTSPSPTTNPFLMNYRPLAGGGGVDSFGVFNAGMVPQRGEKSWYSDDHEGFLTMHYANLSFPLMYFDSYSGLALDAVVYAQGRGHGYGHGLYKSWNSSSNNNNSSGSSNSGSYLDSKDKASTSTGSPAVADDAAAAGRQKPSFAFCPTVFTHDLAFNQERYRIVDQDYLPLSSDDGGGGVWMDARPPLDQYGASLLEASLRQGGADSGSSGNSGSSGSSSMQSSSSLRQTLTLPILQRLHYVHRAMLRHSFVRYHGLQKLLNMCFPFPAQKDGVLLNRLCAHARTAAAAATASPRMPNAQGTVMEDDKLDIVINFGFEDLFDDDDADFNAGDDDEEAAAGDYGVSGKVEQEGEDSDGEGDDEDDEEDDEVFSWASKARRMNLLAQNRKGTGLGGKSPSSGDGVSGRASVSYASRGRSGSRTTAKKISGLEGNRAASGQRSGSSGAGNGAAPPSGGATSTGRRGPGGLRIGVGMRSSSSSSSSSSSPGTAGADYGQRQSFLASPSSFSSAATAPPATSSSPSSSSSAPSSSSPAPTFTFFASGGGQRRPDTAPRRKKSLGGGAKDEDDLRQQHLIKRSWELDAQRENERQRMSNLSVDLAIMRAHHHQEGGF